jgi:hypothetical protein
MTFWTRSALCALALGWGTACGSAAESSSAEDELRAVTAIDDSITITRHGPFGVQSCSVDAIVDLTTDGPPLELIAVDVPSVRGLELDLYRLDASRALLPVDGVEATVIDGALLGRIRAALGRPSGKLSYRRMELGEGAERELDADADLDRDIDVGVGSLGARGDELEIERVLELAEAATVTDMVRVRPSSTPARRAAFARALIRLAMASDITEAALVFTDLDGLSGADRLAVGARFDATGAIGGRPLAVFGATARDVRGATFDVPMPASCSILHSPAVPAPINP